MADLTKIIQVNRLQEEIDAYYEASYKPRLGLGLSKIGHKCPRFLWYSYNKFVPDNNPSGRILRLFEQGNMIEKLVIKDLIACGYSIHSQQYEVSFEYDGYKITGHIDGVIEGLKESIKPHLLEIKSIKDAEFSKLEKARSYEAWKEHEYKAQIHCYMMGLGLERCLVAGYNKNDSNLYFERIRINKEYAVNLLKRVFDIISQKNMPLRTCPKSDWFEAKGCDFYKTCFQIKD